MHPPRDIASLHPTRIMKMKTGPLPRGRRGHRSVASSFPCQFVAEKPPAQVYEIAGEPLRSWWVFPLIRCEEHAHRTGRPRPSRRLPPTGLAGRDGRARRLARSDQDAGAREAQAQAKSAGRGAGRRGARRRRVGAARGHARRRGARRRRLRGDPRPPHHPAAAEPALRAGDRDRARSDRQHQADGPLPLGQGLYDPMRGGRVSAASPISPTGPT